jgi:hypothetical protein
VNNRRQVDGQAALLSVAGVQRGRTRWILPGHDGVMRVRGGGDEVHAGRSMIIRVGVWVCVCVCV